MVGWRRSQSLPLSTLKWKEVYFLWKWKQKKMKHKQNCARQSWHQRYDLHTVLFGSPRSKKMFLQIRDSFGIRLNGCSIVLQHLDITRYLSAPNLINVCNSHLGTVYRIFIDLSDIDIFVNCNWVVTGACSTVHIYTQTIHIWYAVLWKIYPIAELTNTYHQQNCGNLWPWNGEGKRW